MEDRHQSEDDYRILSAEVIAAAIEVHRHLGPGLLESAYESALCRELALRKIRFQRQIELPIHYKGMRIDCSYRVDLIVEDSVLLELKAVNRLDPIHEAQLLTYLRASGLWLGLLLNFNSPTMANGDQAHCPR